MVRTRARHLALVFALAGHRELAAQNQPPCEEAVPPAGCAVLPPTGPDLIGQLPPVSSCYVLRSGIYNYGNVNVVAGGTLFFEDDGGEIDFNVSALLVEQGGSVQAGAWCAPFGSRGGTLTIGLYGTDPTEQGKVQNPADQGIQCVGQPTPGVCYPAGRQGKCCQPTLGVLFDPADPCQATCPNSWGDNAWFEGYLYPLDYDPNFFGYKVLAVSYGGSLRLFGKKGVRPSDFVDPDLPAASCPTPADQYAPQAWADLTGWSWARLGAIAAAGQKILRLDRDVDWAPGDQLVVATTDWQPSHSELVTVADETRGTLTLEKGLAHAHHGELYSVPAPLSEKTGNPNTTVDVRGAVGLLSRSIVIRSLGAAPRKPFAVAAECTTDQPHCYFGGQVMARQGFATFQLQGVELRQLGQGGRKGHYPLHFHMAKSTAYTNAFVKDSSVWESNNRFISVHATHDVTLGRNVGFLSVGHGYYIEDGSEIGNRLCQNLGVSARPAIAQYYAAQDPRSPTARFVPPILDSLADGTVMGSDALFPSMFWVMNGYNEFVGNHAVGVGGFGSCYWPLSSSVSAASQGVTVPDGTPMQCGNTTRNTGGTFLPMHWSRNIAGSAVQQTYSPADYANFNVQGAYQAPLLRFRGNSCSTAPYAFMTERQSLQPNCCLGSVASCPANGPPSCDSFGTTPVANPYAVQTSCLPQAQSDFEATRYLAPGDPTLTPSCNAAAPFPPAPGQESQLERNATYCVTTVLDRFTTSFNWAQEGFGSVWLRPWNYAFLNGAVTDQLFGGLGLVSGGSWNQVLPGYLAVSYDSVFVGKTKESKGPPGPPLPTPSSCSALGELCFLPVDGIGIYTGDLNPQRLITIYDGPLFSSGSVFTAVQPYSCNPNGNGAWGDCGIYQSTDQPAPSSTSMQVVNAGIGWKQPNDFYYPPAFAFARTGFEPGSERHNVVDPNPDVCYWNGSPVGGNPAQMSAAQLGATPIDFSTILNDLDGSLDGVVPAGSTSRRTSAVSASAYFDAPFQAPQCSSFGTQTQPLEYVTTVVGTLNALPASGAPSYVQSSWTTPSGASYPAPIVPIYRQLMTGTAGEDCPVSSVCGTTSETICTQTGRVPWGCRRATFMAGAQLGEAPYLTANQGVYYIDTDAANQSTSCITLPASAGLASFVDGGSYVLYQLFANAGTRVTYQLYVGTCPGSCSGKCTDAACDCVQPSWVRVFPHLYPNAATFSSNNLLVQASSAPLGTSDYDCSTGILTVTLDNTFVAADFGYPLGIFGGGTATTCEPRDICQPGPTSCQRNPAFGEPDLAAAIDEICSYWVTRRYGESDGVYLADCPRGGCVGFAFTLPAGFSPQPYSAVGSQLATCYPNAAPWNVGLRAVDPVCAAGLPTEGNFCNPAAAMTPAASFP